MRNDKDNYWKLRYSLEKQNPIHFLKRFLVKKEVEKIIKTKKLISIADIGCGLGILVEELSDTSSQIFGYDINKEIIRKAKEFSAKPNILFFNQNLFSIHEKEKFEVIIMTEVLEYIKDDVRALKKIKSFLKPGGYVIITVPIRKDLTSVLEKREEFIRYEAKELIEKVEKIKFKVLNLRFWGYPLTNLFYSKVFVFASNKKAASENKCPVYIPFVILLFKIFKYLFLIDLLFHSQKSFDLLLVIQKSENKEQE